MNQGGVDGREGSGGPHVPGPSLWPISVAIGVVCILLGLVVAGWSVVAVGAAITALAGFLWIRDLSRGRATSVASLEPEGGEGSPRLVADGRRDVEPRPANEGEAGMPEPESEAEAMGFPRSRFLEGATLGLGGLIGGLITVPVLGFAVWPAFSGQHKDEVDIGPISAYPEGKFVIATFLQEPAAGEVSRRTAYIRNNGLVKGQPSFTVLSNRCVHLGCPVQSGGLISTDQQKKFKTKAGNEVSITPTQPSGFGCPCHGGQYDTEGNRTAGPPVRALDRFEFSIRNGRLWLGQTFSVSHVVGEGAGAKMRRYAHSGPGEHVDGIESWLYPLQPPS